MSSSDKERRRAELELKIQAHRRKKRLLYIRVGIPAAVLLVVLCVFIGVRISASLKSRPAASTDLQAGAEKRSGDAAGGLTAPAPKAQRAMTPQKPAIQPKARTFLKQPSRSA